MGQAQLAVLTEREGEGTYLLAYDEPDSHLDYRAQRELFDIIDRQSQLDNVQVLVATHSANFIDKVPVTSLRHLRRDQGVTHVEQIRVTDADDEQALLHSIAAGLAPTNSALLGQSGFLVVEGETEAAALPLLFQKKFDRSLVAGGVSVINTQGSGAVRRIAEIVIGEWRRPAIVVVDTDARVSPADLNEEWIRGVGLIEGQTAFFVGTKEFEDLFSDEQWRATASAWFPVGDGGEPWKEADFAAIRSEPKFSDALKSLLSRRARMNVSKPLLGAKVAETIPVQEIPEVIVAALDRTLELIQRQT